MKHSETHVLLWVLVAFCLGTLWSPIVDLASSVVPWVEDNVLLDERRCRNQIETGIVMYECRHYWDRCALNYNDCKSGERYEWEQIREGSWRARQVP